MQLSDKKQYAKSLGCRLFLNKFMKLLFLLWTMVCLVVLITLIVDTVLGGWEDLSRDFVTSFSSSRPESAGIYGAIICSIWLMTVSAPVAIVLSVGTALYLEEYAPKNKITNFITINISYLAGVPSVVFGLLGLTIF